MRADMTEPLIIIVLQQDLMAQLRPHRPFRPEPYPVERTIRGNFYKTLLRDAQARLSHSRRDDNAQAESL